MIYPRSLFGAAVDTRRAAIVIASLVTDAILGARCRYGCGRRFHTEAGHARHEDFDHAGDRP